MTYKDSLVLLRDPALFLLLPEDATHDDLG